VEKEWLTFGTSTALALGNLSKRTLYAQKKKIGPELARDIQFRMIKRKDNTGTHFQYTISPLYHYTFSVYNMLCTSQKKRKKHVYALTLEHKMLTVPRSICHSSR
jgi:hypothetical protein